MWPAEQADVPVRLIHHIPKTAETASTPEKNSLPNHSPAESQSSAESKSQTVTQTQMIYRPTAGLSEYWCTALLQYMKGQ